MDKMDDFFVWIHCLLSCLSFNRLGGDGGGGVDMKCIVFMTDSFPRMTGHLPYLSGYKTGFCPSRMISNN